MATPRLALGYSTGVSGPTTLRAATATAGGLGYKENSWCRPTTSLRHPKLSASRHVARTHVTPSATSTKPPPVSVADATSRSEVPVAVTAVASSSSSSSGSGEAAPAVASPPSEPNLFDIFALALFRRKLVEAVGWSSPKSGYEGMIEEARRLLLMHPNKQRSEEDAVAILRTMFPPGLLPLFKKYIAPIGGGRPAAILTAWVTQLTCQWLMGRTTVVEVEMADGTKLGSGVKVEKCKFLDEAKCVGSCIHTCKMPTQTFMYEQMGVPLFMEPNFEDYSCQFKFGVAAPRRDEDQLLLTPCLAICPSGGSSSSRTSTAAAAASASSSDAQPSKCNQVKV